jgi:RNA polymerase sigma factor (sigma-70 family)
MAINQLWQVIQTISKAPLQGEEAGPTDRQLLESYVSTRAEAAFAALVRRLGPMVWGICRRVLASHHDAEDAFQATFLVLVRKAPSVVSVANWLYGVAHQTALKARATAARRREREKQMPAMPELAVEQPQLWDDLEPVLDQELSRLPAEYREAIILCDLDGKTRKEAARQLNLPEGTVASRLATARTLLARRLARSGMMVSAGALAAALGQHAASAGVPAAVASLTIKAAGHFAAGPAAGAGAVSVRAAGLAEAVLKSIGLTRLKITMALLTALALLASGAAVVGQIALQGPAEKSAEQAATGKPVPADKPVKQARADWPQWRGPNRDGVVHEVQVPGKWPRTLSEQWTVEVGEGVASPVVAGGKIYVFTRQKDNELVRCLDLETGKETWQSQPYAASLKPGPGDPVSFGPRSTPTVSGGKVFTLGATGILSALDEGTGKLLWRKDYQPYFNRGGNSPLVAEGLCIAHLGTGNAGGLRAFDVTTGKVKWCFPDDSPASSSPILVQLGGQRQVVTFTRREYQVSKTDTHPHPVFLGDRILIKDGQALRSLRVGPTSKK